MKKHPAVAEFGLMENRRRSKSLTLCDQVQTDLLFMIIFLSTHSKNQ